MVNSPRGTHTMPGGASTLVTLRTEVSRGDTHCHFATPPDESGQSGRASWCLECGPYGGHERVGAARGPGVHRPPGDETVRANQHRPVLVDVMALRERSLPDVPAAVAELVDVEGDARHRVRDRCGGVSPHVTGRAGQQHEVPSHQV